MKKIFLGCFILLVSTNLIAQEQRVFSQFFMNPYIYNPAYAGAEGHSALFVMHRTQYTGLNGGPTFSHANFHTPMAKGVGLGGMVYNEVEGGILKTSGFKATASYLIAHDRKHYFRFGMSLGAGTTSLDASNPAIAADIFGDPAFANLSNQHLIADFGISYHFDHFNVGIAIPNLVSREVISSESFSPIKISPLDNMLIKVNYRGHISHDFAIEPHLLYRYSNVTTSQYEAAVIAHLKHIVWVGASYREGAGINLLAGFKIKEKMAIGYAFEMGNSDKASITGATHELHIGYHLSEHKKHHGHGHRSSFIKSHKLSAEERAALAEKKQLAQEEKDRKAQERLDKLNEVKEPAKAEEVVQTEVNTNEQAEAEQKDVREPVIGQPKSVEDIEKQENSNLSDNRTSEKEKVTVGSIQENNTVNNGSEENNNLVNSEEEITSPEGAPRVKRGTHILELPPGNHVIAGAFSEFDRAENYSDLMFQRGFHDTVVGYQSEKGYYYVVLFRSANHTDASKQRTRIRKNKGLEEVWILTVE
jgi:type IX secretion system PorP/SprF family membrane protein